MIFWPDLGVEAWPVFLGDHQTDQTDSTDLQKPFSLGLQDVPKEGGEGA